MDFINRLKEKPASTKKIIAFSTSAVITLVILSLWVTVFRFNINSKNTDITASANNSSDVNPFSAFWNVVSTGWTGLTKNVETQVKVGTAGFNNIANVLNSASSTGSANGSVNTSARPATESPKKDVFIISDSDVNR